MATRSPDLTVVQQQIGVRDDVRQIAAGEAAARGTTPVASTIASKPRSVAACDDARFKLHGDAADARSSFVKYRIVSPKSRFPGMRRAMRNWPPSSLSASNSSTRCPSAASARALSIPAGPPPITANRRGHPRLPRVFGKLALAPGARIDHARNRLVEQRTIDACLIARDARVDQFAVLRAALATIAASARNGRAIETKSALPAASTSSAAARQLMRLLAITGTLAHGALNGGGERAPRRRSARAAAPSVSRTRASRCRR